MKIELRNIKHIEAQSDETHCYSASLYVDGKKIGEVGNQGFGGPDNFHGDQEAFNKAEAWLAANTPEVDLGEGLGTIKMDMEIFCGDLVNLYLARKHMKADTRRKVLFIEPGDPNLYQMSFKKVTKIEAQHIAYVRDKHPQAVILNELPEEEALKLYREHG